MAYEPFLDQDPDAPFGAQPRVLKQALGRQAAPAYAPGLSPEELRQKAFDVLTQSQQGPTEEETAAMRQYAQQRHEQAQRDFERGMVMSVLGGSAFQPVGAQVLKQALAMQAPEKIGGGIVQGGQFLTDPEQSSQNRQKRLEAQAKLYEMMAHNAESVEQKQAAAQAAADLRRQLAGQHDPLVQVYDPVNKTTTYMPRSQASGEQAPPRRGQQLPTHAIDELTKRETKVAQFDTLLSSWKPEYGGYGTSIGNISGRYNPLAGKTQQEQAQWWQLYQEFVNDVRHGQFGSALTPTEKAEFDKAIIAPDMDQRNIVPYLERQRKIAAIAHQRYLSNLGKAGYDMSSYNTAGPPPEPGSGGATGSWGGAAGGATSWNQLPPG